jgi:integrase
MGRAYIRPGANGGAWYIEYYYKGKQKKERVGRVKDGITEKKAKKALHAREGEIAQGRFNIAQTKTYPLFEKFIKDYLDYSKTHKRSYERDLTSSKHLTPFFNNKTIDEITPLMIERYKKSRKDEIKAMKKNQGKSDREISFVSINRELALMKHSFSMGIKWGVIDKNPVKGIKMFPEKKRINYLKDYEVPALMEACEKSKNNNLKAIVITAITTGARLREILNIKIKDIDFKTSKINLRHTKTGENDPVTMSEHLIEVLRDHLKSNNESEYLFCNSDGSPLKDIRTAFNNALKEAGIKDCRFHDLRHTFASHLAMKGVKIRTLQELGRWKTISMVMRYAHLSPEHQKEAVDTLGDLFNNKYNTSTNLIQADFSKEGTS